MECKVSPLSDRVVAYDGFNRDIVECKDVMQTGYGIQQASFNRDIVECKVKLTAFSATYTAGVLIET